MEQQLLPATETRKITFSLSLLHQITFIFLFLVNFAFGASAQVSEQWKKIFTGDDLVNDRFHDDWFPNYANSNQTSSLHTSDGGYLLGGYSDADVGADKSETSYDTYEYWIIKLDPSGNKAWDKTFHATYSNPDYWTIAMVMIILPRWLLPLMGAIY